MGREMHVRRVTETEKLLGRWLRSVTHGAQLRLLHLKSNDSEKIPPSNAFLLPTSSVGQPST